MILGDEVVISGDEQTTRVSLVFPSAQIEQPA